MKRTNDHSRLLRPQGNRASLQRHCHAEVNLVRNGSDEPLPEQAPAAPPVNKRWRRRPNTY